MMHPPEDPFIKDPPEGGASPESGPDPAKGGGAYEPDRELVFYYSRERRLARASPAVRALNEPGPPVKRGLIRSLTATRPLLLLFISLIGIMVMLVFYSATLPLRGGLTLGGNSLRISASQSQGRSFLVVTKSMVKNKEPYTGAVDIVVSPVLRDAAEKSADSMPVASQMIFFTLEPEEEYRFSVPFGGDELWVLFQAGDQRASVRVKPEK